MIHDFVASLQINPYTFSNEGSAEYVLNKHMANSWPIVYIIKNDHIGEAYVGESTNALNRMKNHLANDDRKRLKELLVISCDKFNKSVVLDIESRLISYMDADKRYKLQNGNAGLVNHNYYQKEQYQQVFEKIWEMLMKGNYAKNPIQRLDNSDLFKYSPYKSLTADQHESVVSILTCLNQRERNTIFVEGGAGTGKTILAVYLMKLLKTRINDHHFDEDDEVYSAELKLIKELQKKQTKPLKIALVVPMTSLRKTLKRVFSNVQGLSGSMVIGPSEAAKEEYDIIIVDEAHRLRQRKNITNFGSFDETNARLGFDKYEGNELDWILKMSKHQIFFYDEGQSIKPSDIGVEYFRKHKWSSSLLKLTSQMRVKGGMDYISFVDNLLHARLEPEDGKFKSDSYELKLYDSLTQLHTDLKEKNKQFGLCRLLSGYSWEWKSLKDKSKFDVEIDGLKLQWNNQLKDWINHPNAINEVGCIHTTQGYDLNYTGIIFGEEIKYNTETKQIEIDASKYKDKKGKQGIEDPALLKEYIINIYKTMMLRGIKGTYLYVCDVNLKTYFKSFIYQ